MFTQSELRRQVMSVRQDGQSFDRLLDWLDDHSQALEESPTQMRLIGRIQFVVYQHLYEDLPTAVAVEKLLNLVPAEEVRLLPSVPGVGTSGSSVTTYSSKLPAARCLSNSTICLVA